MINSGNYFKEKNKEKFYHLILLTNSHKILPRDICSPSIFKAVINALYICRCLNS